MRRLTKLSSAALGLILLISLLAIWAWASLPTGSRSTPDSSGVHADGAIWTGTADGGTDGFKIAWNITFDSGTNLWTYSYTISDEGGGTFSQGAPSHFILELSTTITSATTETCDATNEICFSSLTDIEGPDTFGDEGDSNPGIPGDIYGIKFDSLTCNPCTFTFQTLQPPVWGDFYAKDGTAGSAEPPANQEFNIAYNTQFGVAPTVNDSPFTGWIPRPDGDSIPLTTTTTTTTSTTTTSTTTTTTTTSTTNTTTPLTSSTTTSVTTTTAPTTTTTSTTTTTAPTTTTTSSTTTSTTTTTTSTTLDPSTTTTTSTTLTTLPFDTTTTTLPSPTTTTTPVVIPAVGDWGMAALGLAFLGVMAWMLRVRRSIR